MHQAEDDGTDDGARPEHREPGDDRGGGRARSDCEDHGVGGPGEGQLTDRPTKREVEEGEDLDEEVEVGEVDVRARPGSGDDADEEVGEPDVDLEAPVRKARADDGSQACDAERQGEGGDESRERGAGPVAQGQHRGDGDRRHDLDADGDAARMGEERPGEGGCGHVGGRWWPGIPASFGVGHRVDPHCLLPSGAGRSCTARRGSQTSSWLRSGPSRGGRTRMLPAVGRRAHGAHRDHQGSQ